MKLSTILCERLVERLPAYFRRERAHCRHDGEPGCAVRRAVKTGELAAERLEHYLELEREAQAYEERHDVRLRRQEGRMWGQLHREAARLRRWKGGKA